MPTIRTKETNQCSRLVQFHVVLVGEVLVLGQEVAMEMTKHGAPLDIVFGWSKGGSLKLALDYVLFGQGDIPNRVVDLLDNAITDPARLPTVIVG